MDIEVLHLEDCPGFTVAVAMVQDVVASIGRKADIRMTLISDLNRADFAGSPTVLVNGKDIYYSSRASKTRLEEIEHE